MVRQSSFALGQVDKRNWKRMELAEYLTGCQSLQNMIITTTGAATKRLGTNVKLDISSQSNIPFTRAYQLRDIHGNFYMALLEGQTANIYSVDSGIVTFYQTVSGLPYAATDVPRIDYSANDDVLVLTHQSYPPGRIYAVTYTAGLPVWGYQALAIFPIPSQDFGNINYNNFPASLTVLGTTFTLVLTGVAPFTTAWIGGQIIGLGNSDLQPLGLGLITNVVNSGTSTTFTGVVQVPFNTSTPGTLGSQYAIRQPAWSAALGYPGKTVFYQNRLWLAATPSLQTTIFGSQINQPLNYDVGTGNDANAIVYDIGSGESGNINWLNAGKQLEIFCENQEFACPQELNIALTPQTFSVRQQSSFGSSELMKPVSYINDSYYLSKNGRSLNNFHFNGIGQTYASTNITVQSQDLMLGIVKANLIQAYSSEQDNVIFFQVFDGPNDFTMFQFAAEYKLAALTPMVFDQRFVDDRSAINVVCTVVVDNELYMIKDLQISGVRVIEGLEIQQNEIPFYLDSESTNTLQASGLITGIPYLNGYNAHLFYEGQDFGTSMQMVNGELVNGVVANGQCYFGNPNGNTGFCNVGILFENNIVPMYIWAGAIESNYKKQITQIFIDYYESLDFRVNGKLVFYQDYTDVQAGTQSMVPHTDTAIVEPMLGWERFQTFTISQRSPFNLTVSAIAYQVDRHII